MREHTPEWVVAVLEDLRTVCARDRYQRSAILIDQFLEVLATETGPDRGSAAGNGRSRLDR